MNPNLVRIVITTDAETTHTPEQAQALVQQLMQGALLQGFLRSKGLVLKTLSVQVDARR